MTLEKRSLTIAGHRTSIALEPEFWAALADLAEGEGLSLPAFVARVDAGRPPSRGLASALRVAVLTALRQPSR